MEGVPMTRCSLACILPPDLILRIAQQASPEERLALLHTLELDHSFRQARAEIAARHVAGAAPSGPITVGGTPHRVIYDQQHSTATTPGTLMRAEGGPAVADQAINDAYDNFGFTYDLYWQVFHRNSIDDRGMTIEGLVHFGTNYANAFWDGGRQMFFGDGDGQLLTQTTKGLDVIGHELTHGVTQYEANLTYSGQSGALNESISDVFGSLVKQHHLNQSADKADWLIGADIVGPQLAPALRSMKAPGTANRYDTQPADMDHYVHTTQDNGGVHTNSGIPNHAFYVAATTIGGPAWQTAGTIWYDALTDPQLRPTTNFRTFAKITIKHARTRYGASSREATAVKAGWDAVKVPVI